MGSDKARVLFKATSSCQGTSWGKGTSDGQGTS